MSGRKRQRAVCSSGSEACSSSSFSKCSCSSSKKRAVQRGTVEKWIAELDRELDHLALAEV